METITSRTNPLCTHIRKLASSRSYRERQGQFLCDSPKLLEEALAHGGEVRTVIFTERAAPGGLPSQVRQVQVPPDVMGSLSPSQTPQGVLTVCALPERSLPKRLEGRRYLVLDGVQDPGNVGTILRTADAFGADGLFLVNGCADLYNPKTVRATMGAVFRCPAWTCRLEEAEHLLRASGLPLYGTALRADTADVRAVDYSRCALAVGSEGRGLSAQLLAACDGTVRIPMRAHCESLNAAIADAVVLWEAARDDR